MTDTIKTRVARGVALLDERKPGWVERIDLDKLDLASECRCVLGQTWGGEPAFDPYNAAIDVLFPGDMVNEAAAYGFDSYGGSLDFRGLTAEWTRVIEARRSAS